MITFLSLIFFTFPKWMEISIPNGKENACSASMFGNRNNMTIDNANNRRVLYRKQYLLVIQKATYH